MRFGDSRLPLRFWRRVTQDPNGCWLWDKAGRNGYGAVHHREKRRSYLAHRWSYEVATGEDLGDRNIDHCCHNQDLSCPGGLSCHHRRCVNPSHLEALGTVWENAKRGRSPAAANAKKTHCFRGHEFTAENTRTTRSGTRACRACWKANDEKLAARKLAHPERYASPSPEQLERRRMRDREFQRRRRAAIRERRAPSQKAPNTNRMRDDVPRNGDAA